MTLIELLVAVAVLSIMILMFAMILNDAQKVVASSNQAMRANAKAAAIAETIRSDVRRITQNGFLCITEHPGDQPQIIFTTAGVSSSVKSDVMGTAEVVAYGLCDNPAAADPNNKVLWRKAWVLNYNADISDIPDPHDIWNQHDLTELQKLWRGQINDLITNEFLAPPNKPEQLSVSAGVGLDNIEALWQCLTDDCTGLSIMWTDGLGDPDDPNALGWYGLQERPDGSTYRSKEGVTPTNNYDGHMEFLTGNGDSKYRVLCTRHWVDGPLPDDPANTTGVPIWPKAIRIRFTLAGGEGSLGEELQDTGLGAPDEFGRPDAEMQRVYEVICPVAQ